MPPGQDHQWCGGTRISAPQLQAGQLLEVPLHVAVFAPGLYELSDYCVSWDFPDLPDRRNRMQGPPFLLNVGAA